jgi:hypothetical protein
MQLILLMMVVVLQPLKHMLLPVCHVPDQRLEAALQMLPPACSAEATAVLLADGPGPSESDAS